MKIEVGTKLSISGKTKKGKERIKQWGADNWVVMKKSDSVIFSSENGPWLFVDNGQEKASRWIHETNDQDFTIASVYS